MAEEDTMLQDMMNMVMVVMMVAVLSQMIPGAAAPAVAAGRNITVTLKNPPSSGLWQLMLIDYNVTENRVIRELGMSDSAVFTDLPSHWLLPLRIELSVYEADLQVYKIQSYLPFFWDFDKMEWGTEPDPTYKELLLPAFGGYYFDFDTEEFTAA